MNKQLHEINEIRRRSGLSVHKPEAITESYKKGLGDDVWVQIFEHYGKLTGVHSFDKNMLDSIRLLAEESVDVDFDPFSHLVSSDTIEEKTDCVLSFSRGNDKLKQLDVVYLSLPAGYTCPMADICKSMANRKTGKITDFGDIRCYAASAEARYPATRERNWRNFDLLRKFKGDVQGMADLILRSIEYYEAHNPPIKLFRPHESGDFFSQEYFDAWIEVAKARPDILFYAYTKSLHFWEKRKDVMPKNLRLIASEGGKVDELISKNQFRTAIIVKDTGEAIKRRLNIDVNEFLAAFSEEDFALLLHGTQSKKVGTNPQSLKNAKILKAAKKLRADPEEINRLFQYYTNK